MLVGFKGVEDIGFLAKEAISNGMIVLWDILLVFHYMS